MHKTLPVLVLVALPLSGCKGGGAASPHPRTSSSAAVVTTGTALPTPGSTAVRRPTLSPAPSPAPTTGRATVAPKPSSELVLSEELRGRTVTVAAGTRLLVRLHNTYWEVAASPSPGVVATSGPQASHPDPAGSCLPGIGCGTVERPFLAVGPGSARLSASRTSCGEALSCTGDEGSWSVLVRVT